MKTCFPAACAVLLTALPSLALAGFAGGSTPPPDDVLRKRAADAIGFEPEEITVTDVKKDDVSVSFKAQLADGTIYRCTIASFSGFVRFMSMGAGNNVAADCVKRPGSGKGPEARESPFKAASKARGER